MSAAETVRRLYWLFHVLITWMVGAAVLIAGAHLSALSAEILWPTFALGIVVILLGEISRRNRRKATIAE